MGNIIVSLEPVEGIKKCMKVRVPGERIEYYTNKIQEIVDDVDCERLVVKNSLRDAVDSMGIMLASPPEVHDVTSINNGGYSYTALFEIYPDIPVPELDGFKAIRLKAEVCEEDVQRTIVKLRKQHSSWKAVNRVAVTGDRVTIDLYAVVGDINVHETNVDATIGENDLLEGLDASLPGAMAGDELTLNLKFPEEFYPDLAGKQAEFSVKVNKIEELVLPDLDEKFIIDHGVSSGELDHFYRVIRNNMEKQLHDAVKMKTTIMVMSDLLAQCHFDVPSALVEKEVNRLICDPDKEEQGGHSLDLNPQDFRGLARKRIARSLLAYKLAGHHDIKLDEARLRSRVCELTEGYADPERKISWYYEDRERMSWIESEVLEHQVVEWIMERADITDQTSSYDEIMAIWSF